MKVKTNVWDTMVYVIMCVLTMGTLYFVRVTITQGVKMAFEDKK
jgi:hypothetical protein